MTTVNMHHLTPYTDCQLSIQKYSLKKILQKSTEHRGETQLFNKCGSVRCWHFQSRVARFVCLPPKELVSSGRLFWRYYESSTCSLWLWHCFQGGCLLWCASTGNACGEGMTGRQREKDRQREESTRNRQEWRFSRQRKDDTRVGE